MAESVQDRLKTVVWRRMGPYIQDISEGRYKGDVRTGSINVATLRGLQSRLTESTKPVPPQVIKNLGTVIELIKEEAGLTNAPVLASAGNSAAAPVPTTEAPPNPCPVLYDPCTREPLPDFRTLEKRVLEIKRGNDTTPVGLYGLTNATTNYEFIMGPFLDKTISLDNLVSFRLGAHGQIGSDIYEVLSRLFVFFGGINGVNPQQGGNYKFMKKFEARAPTIYDSPRAAFEAMTCKATSASGISDITLVRAPGVAGGIQRDQPYCESDCTVSPDGSIIQRYIMSVKWYKREKSAEHYDLEKLKVAAAELAPGETTDIIVFLKSKRDFERAHQRAYRQYVRHVGKTFFGWEEDVKPFLQDIRRQIFEEADLKGADPRAIVEERYFQPGAKPSLGLQLHQEIIVDSICDAFSVSEDNRFLIGVLPRGGKTYIAGGVIREFIRRAEARSVNILWLTAAPTETRSQVGRDLIEKFQDFSEFEFIDVKGADSFEKKKPFSFFFCSTQLLTQMGDGTEERRKTKKKREYLETLLKRPGELGLIFYDEAHKTATGTRTREEIDRILEVYAGAHLPLIFLTATYYNILFDYKILVENTFIWDYTDVLKTRGLATESDQVDAITNLKERFRNPGRIDRILERRQRNGESLFAMGKPYLDFPELYFISTDFQREAIQRFEEQAVYSPDAGFRMSSIFSVRREVTLADIRAADGSVRADAYRVFENVINPRNIVSLLTPAPVGFSDAEEGGAPLAKEAGVPLEPSLLGRINAISRMSESRFRVDENPTLMMFMPTGGEGSRIYYTLCAWASLLVDHPWWRERYEVACVVDSGTLTATEIAEASALGAEGATGIHILRRDPKAEIMELERRLHCSGSKKGLVVLAGQKLSMGVSLPCTDVVFLFNDSKSPDDIIQKMYRALTPSIGKRAAFVVDLNPVRSFGAVYGYTRAAGGESATTSTLLDILYDTYSWDADFFDHELTKGAAARPQAFQERLRELFHAAEKDPEYRVHEDFGGIERRVETNIRDVMDMRMVEALSEHLSDKRAGRSGFTIELHDGSKASLKSGQLVIRSAPVPVEGEGPPEEDAEPPAEEIIIENFVEAVKDFVKYLAITSRFNRLEEAIREYAEDGAFQANVNGMMVARGAILRPDPRVVEIMITTVQELLRQGRGSAMVRMFGDTRSKIEEQSARKNAVLKIIHQRLTPRNRQKKDFGEVFTPIELIEEMLSHLPAAVWKNPDLKWLDPANGIGNFPVVVFYKLDEGLKDIIPIEKARRKHIVEKMLYMMELQSSNNRIALNIFRKLCDGCSPNIWKINTLETDNAAIFSHFNVENFDIIMGNPPFQAFQEASGKRGGGDELYMKFVKKALELLKPSGHLVFVHPPSWRKPSYTEGRKISKNAGMFQLMTHDNQMIYLAIHNSVDGQKMFRASTRYDFYYIKKHPAERPTTIRDELGKTITLDLRALNFLPNYNITNILNLLASRGGAGEDSCSLDNCILFSASTYETRREWVRSEKTSEFKYPLIHSTPKSGPRLFYTNDTSRGFFGIKKVIFGDSGINEPIIDIDGTYGMTQHAMAIRVDSRAEAVRLSTFLKSNYFTNILQSCMWSSFQIDWRLFTYFKNKFWLEEIDIDEPLVEQGGGARTSKYRKTRKLRRSQA